MREQGNKDLSKACERLDASLSQARLKSAQCNVLRPLDRRHSGLLRHAAIYSLQLRTIIYVHGGPLYAYPQLESALRTVHG